MHELLALSGKTVESAQTTDSGCIIEQVSITFKDGSILVIRGMMTLRLQTPTPPAIVSARSEWPGE